MATDPTNADPFDYRWFTVDGTLVADGQSIKIIQGVHADDLPEGDAGKREMAERVRRHYAARHNDPDAHWQELNVSETPPEDGYFDVRFPFDPPEPNDERRSVFEVDIGDRAGEGDG